MQQILTRIRNDKKVLDCQFSDSLKYSQNITKRISQSIEFYKSYISSLDGALTKLQKEDFPEELKKDLADAPGVPGNDQTLLSSYLKLIKTLYMTQEVGAFRAKRDIIDRLTELENNFNETMGNLTAEVNKKSLALIDCLKKNENVLASITHCRDYANQLHEDYQNDPCEKNKKALDDICEDFRGQKVTCKALYKELVLCNRSFIETVKNAILKIKVAEISRCSELKCIVFTHAQNFDQASESIKEICDQINGTDGDWKKEFTAFAIRNGIVRKSFSPMKFNPLEFTFEDPYLKFKLPPVAATTLDSPLAFAVVKKDYESEELTLKEGERVYIYDSLNGEKSFIETKDRTGYFVPSDVIEEIKGDYEVLTMPYIASEEGEISVSAGDIVLVVSEDDSIKYEKIDGTKGTLPQCVFLDAEEDPRP